MTAFDCSNDRGYHVCQLHISIPLSRLIPQTEEIIGDHQCVFRRNRSTTDQIFFAKKWECNEAVYQQSVDFKEVNDSVRREELCNILIEFGIPLKPLTLIKICLKNPIAESE